MGRRGLLNFFTVGGVVFVVVGVIAFTRGGEAGRIASLTFFLIGGIWVAVSLLVTAGYRKMAASQLQEMELFRTGTRATAVVQSVETTGTVLNDINLRIILTLRVTPQYGEPFTHVRKLFVPTFAVPRPGDLINVAYDANDTSRVALELNPASNTAGGMQLVTRSPGGPAMPAGQQPSSPITDLEALERLQALRTQGALTDAEFEIQKRKIIESH